MDKRSSLLRKFVTQGRKKFYKIGPGDLFSLLFAMFVYHDKWRSIWVDSQKLLLKETLIQNFDAVGEGGTLTGKSRRRILRPFPR